jgi:hypothetical protein
MAYDNTNRSSRPNRGVLFKNVDKESSKHADYKGNINVNGEEFWLDAWINVSKAGAKYMSLSIKPKRAAVKAGARVPFNDEVPFVMEWRG